MMPSEPTTLHQLHVDQLDLNNPFWQFSLEQWRNPALQNQLLHLQNTQGIRINIILLAMWMSFEHRDIRSSLRLILDETKAWHEQVVAPLRKTRISLPGSADALKKQVQACELQAEQIEQALLFASSRKFVPEHTLKPHNKTYDSLDWLILNLSASGLAESDLSLVVQACLPSYPVHRVEERITQHRLSSNDS